MINVKISLIIFSWALIASCRCLRLLAYYDDWLPYLCLFRAVRCWMLDQCCVFIVLLSPVHCTVPGKWGVGRTQSLLNEHGSSHVLKIWWILPFWFLKGLFKTFLVFSSMYTLNSQFLSLFTEWIYVPSKTAYNFL